MAKVIKTDAPETATENLPSVEPARISEDLAVSARTLSFAHRAGYAEGYTDCAKETLMVVTALSFCAVILYRLYSESK